MSWADAVPDAHADADREVVVVTGGALGIGAAIAESLARGGARVVVVDPGVTVDGRSLLDEPAQSSDTPVGDAGGLIRRSRASVTDGPAIERLFTDVRDELGALDAVVNVAGITRPTGFASGSEDDWAAVVTVHLDGYLNVLRAALPIMAAARRGRILGVTSGSGWRAADAGAYSCAKRAVAALTWQLGRVAPEGVTVDALSPIALTRMVTGATQRPATAPTGASAGRASTGGLSLAAMPAPAHLGPVGAFLAGEALAWSSGDVFFSNGSELAPIAPPQLLEAARAVDVASLRVAIGTVLPAFAAAEASQSTHGASNARFADALDAVADGAVASRAADDGAGRRCAVVTDDPTWAASMESSLSARGAATVAVVDAVARDFDGAASQLAGLTAGGPLDAIVVALADRAAVGVAVTADGEGWQRALGDHAGVSRQILGDAAWIRAIADHSAATDRPVRILTVTEAVGPGGRTRAQASAQLARAAHLATGNRVDAFAVSVESAEDGRYLITAELAAHLVCDPGAAALSGAELVVAPAWFGLRSHPRAAGSISFGGPDVPSWLGDLLRDMVPAPSEFIS